MYTTTVNYLLYLKRNRVSGYILVHTPSFIKDETEYLTCFQMWLTKEYTQYYYASLILNSQEL